MTRITDKRISGPNGRDTNRGNILEQLGRICKYFRNRLKSLNKTWAEISTRQREFYSGARQKIMGAQELQKKIQGPVE